MLNEDRPAFQSALLSWFASHSRSFPWREKQDPFAILISEKLLQQTAARPSVIRAYAKLLDRYPGPESLATANVDTLETILKPLGLTYRSRELPLMARAIIDRHGGDIPDTLEELLALPGVGDYTARAVLSFAYGHDMPVVDTNVARWLYRLDGIPGALPSNPARKKPLIARAAELVPQGRSREWNYAVLDLCALVCKARKPICPVCPVRDFCTYGSQIAVV